MFFSTRPSTLIASIPFWAAPSSPFAFLPSRIVLLAGPSCVPSIVSPSKSLLLLGAVDDDAFDVLARPDRDDRLRLGVGLLELEGAGRVDGLLDRPVLAAVLADFEDHRLRLLLAGLPRRKPWPDDAETRARQSPRTRAGTGNRCFMSLLAASCVGDPASPRGDRRRAPCSAVALAQSSLADPGRSARQNRLHRLFQFEHPVGALEAVLDHAVGADQEGPRLGRQAECLQLWADPLVDFVVVVDLLWMKSASVRTCRRPAGRRRRPGRRRGSGRGPGWRRRGRSVSCRATSAKSTSCIWSGGTRVSIFSRSSPTSAAVRVWIRGGRSPTFGTCGYWPTTGLGTREASSPFLPFSIAIASQGPVRLKSTFGDDVDGLRLARAFAVLGAVGGLGFQRGRPAPAAAPGPGCRRPWRSRGRRRRRRPVLARA